MVGVGVVGYGYAGRSFHSYLVPLADGLELRAIATRDRERQERARRERDVVVYNSLSDMLEDPTVELVVLATPHDLHAVQAIEAMNAGRHVVTDKVMCLNAREADSMIEAARRNKVMLSVFHNRRWDWDYLTVKDVLAKGLIGTPYLFESSVMTYRPPRGWRAQAEVGGGILYDWGAHLLDQAVLLIPEPVDTVQCHIQYRRWGASIGSYGRILLRFNGGTLFQIEVGNLSRSPKPRWYVLGEEGAFVRRHLDPQEEPLRRGDIDSASETPEMAARLFVAQGDGTVERPVETVRGSWKSYYQNVAEHLVKGQPLAVTPEQVRMQIAIFDAARESARTGEAVHPTDR